MKTLALSLSIAAIMTESHDASDIKTASAGINAVARAVKAFSDVTSDSKRPTFASIAGVARVTESDAVALVQHSQKDSAFRNALKVLRRGIVQRVLDASVVHDASDDSADVVTIDRMVSNLDTVAKFAKCVDRDLTKARAAAASA